MLNTMQQTDTVIEEHFAAKDKYPLDQKQGEKESKYRNTT